MSADLLGRSEAFVRRRIWVSVYAANAVGLAYLLAAALVTNPGNNPEANQLVGAAGAGDIIQIAGFVLVAGLIGHVLVVRASRAATDAARSSARSPAAVLGLPGRLASSSLVTWMIAAVLFSSSNWIGQHDPAAAVRLAIAIAIAGVGTSAVVLLAVERSARPLFAAVLKEAPARRLRTLGIWPRLGIAWALGSLIPLVMLVVLKGTDLPSHSDDDRPLVVLVVAGIVVGGLATTVAARSLVDPLARLRRVVSSVAGGDLGVDLVVDDGGEIGELQGDVMAMVVGLRERRRVEDLFGRHVGAEVAQEALRSGVALGGDHAEITAMFVDVIGSTAMALREPPAAVVQKLNRFFATVVRCVDEFGGWVKFEGDGALAVFGAPLQQADHATRGLRAARRLRAELDAYETDLRTAVGLSTGLALVGNVGSEQRYEFTVIGDPVNEAARLTDKAKTTPGGILVSGRSIERAVADEARAWQPEGSVVLRGRDEPTATFRLVPPAPICR